MILVIVVAISTVFVGKKLLFPKMKYPAENLQLFLETVGMGGIAKVIGLIMTPMLPWNLYQQTIKLPN